MMWHGPFAVFRFELSRTLTISRIAVWLLLTSFPIFIVGVIKYNEDSFEPPDFTGYSGRMHEVSVQLDNGDKLSMFVRKRGSRRVARLIIERGGSKRTFDNVVIPEYVMLRNNAQIKNLAETVDELLAQQSGSIRELAPGEETAEPPQIPDSAWGLILFGLIPEVITLFGLLLWVTPVVQAELEGRTWIYLAVRRAAESARCGASISPPLPGQPCPGGSVSRSAC